MQLHIHTVPEHEVRREPVGDMWCFYCCKRLPHDAVVYAPNDPLSYYGPRWQYKCSRCGRDATLMYGSRNYYFEGEGP